MKPIRISKNFYQCLPENLYSRIETHYLADYKFWDGTSYVASPRYGKSKIWNFHYDTDYVKIPTLDSLYNKSFEEVTDTRAIEIREILNRRQEKLAVFWSGGIDSTVVLSSLIRNFSKEELSAVTVFMNNISYIENPIFFKKIIEKHNLRIRNIGQHFTTTDLQQTFVDYIVTDGFPADKLWIAEAALKYILINGNNSICKPFREEKSSLINFLSQYMSISQSNYYYNFIVDNINETGSTVDTVGDFFWWINFNFHMSGQLLYWYFMFPNKSADIYNLFKQNYYPWYNTADYQLWSNSDRTAKMFSTDRIDLYKKPAKDYIYSVVSDNFYLTYKSKMTSFRGFQGPDNEYVILENGELLDHNDPAILNEFISQNCLVDFT